MFLFGIGKYPFNGLRTQGIQVFTDGGMTNVFRLLDKVMPNVLLHNFCVIFTMGTLQKKRTIFAKEWIAFELAITVPGGCLVWEYLIVWTKNTVIIIIVDIFIGFKESLFVHRSFIGKYGNASVFQYFFADCRCFVTRICHNITSLWKFAGDLFIKIKE